MQWHAPYTKWTGVNVKSLHNQQDLGRNPILVIILYSTLIPVEKNELIQCQSSHLAQECLYKPVVQKLLFEGCFIQYVRIFPQGTFTSMYSRWDICMLSGICEECTHIYFTACAFSQKQGWIVASCIASMQQYTNGGNSACVMQSDQKGCRVCSGTCSWQSLVTPTVLLLMTRIIVTVFYLHLPPLFSVCNFSFSIHNLQDHLFHTSNMLVIPCGPLGLWCLKL